MDTTRSDGQDNSTEPYKTTFRENLRKEGEVASTDDRRAGTDVPAGSATYCATLLTELTIDRWIRTGSGSRCHVWRIYLERAAGSAGKRTCLATSPTRHAASSE